MILFNSLKRSIWSSKLIHAKIKLIKFSKDTSGVWPLITLLWKNHSLTNSILIFDPFDSLHKDFKYWRTWIINEIVTWELSSELRSTSYEQERGNSREHTIIKIDFYFFLTKVCMNPCQMHVSTWWLPLYLKTCHTFLQGMLRAPKTSNLRACSVEGSWI